MSDNTVRPGPPIDFSAPIPTQPSSNSTNKSVSETCNTATSASIKQKAPEPKWLDNVIEKMNSLCKDATLTINNILTMDDIVLILNYVRRIFDEEGSLVEVEVPIKVIGDIHGQYHDMHKLFDLIGRVPEQRLIFLGDYIDRGSHSLETICYLLALKLRYRDRIYLLRGNHETPAVNRVYGFYDECARKYKVGLWWDFQTIFNYLPMAGLISKRILCMHGGLSPQLTNLDQLRKISRPCTPTDQGLLIDLIWADPTNKGEGWFRSARGISMSFGKAVTKSACKTLGVDLIIRAHQVVQDGYEIAAGGQLITVFSAPNYANEFSNAGAVVCIDEDLQVSFQQIRTPTPASCTRVAPPVQITIANERLHANGVFSNVYRAELLSPVQQLVAIKKVWLSKTSIENATREIDLLRCLDHPCVISLLYRYRFGSKDEICECLVFDFLPIDLSKLRTSLPGRRFDLLDAKLYSWQMFAAVDYVNGCGITHCDLKPSNLIVDHNLGLLRLADFGNAKILRCGESLPPYQVTRYYRAPELVFGTTEFTMSIDRWSAGCVLAELLIGKPLLCGRDSVEQGRLIVEVLGYPTAEQIKSMRISRPRVIRRSARGFAHVSFSNDFSHSSVQLIAGVEFPSEALDIVKRLLVYEPNMRMPTAAILPHKFFDQLRSFPAPKRSNGRSIPPLHYWISEQSRARRFVANFRKRNQNVRIVFLVPLYNLYTQVQFLTQIQTILMSDNLALNIVRTLLLAATGSAVTTILTASCVRRSKRESKEESSAHRAKPFSISSAVSPNAQHLKPKVSDEEKTIAVQTPDSASEQNVGRIGKSPAPEHDPSVYRDVQRPDLASNLLSVIHHDRTHLLVPAELSEEEQRTLIKSMANPSKQTGQKAGTHSTFVERVETFGSSDEITFVESTAENNNSRGQLLPKHVNRSVAEDLKTLSPTVEPLLVRLIQNGPRQFNFDYDELADLLQRGAAHFASESSLLESAVPCAIYGDLHGQYSDLHRWLNLNGWPNRTRSIFLGDFVDRGTHGVEVIALITLLKLQFPDRVFVIRGNHEEETLNRAYSFYEEVCYRFNEEDPTGKRGHQMYMNFKNLFIHLPLAVLIGGRILAMHGGISPKLSSLQAIREIKRPIDDFDVGSLECDLVWSDPDTKGKNHGFRPNLDREPQNGIGQLFSSDTVKSVCERLGVDLIIRGHQAPLYGYAFFAEGQMMTLFSAPGYKGSTTEDVNMGACVELSADMRMTIKQVRVSPTLRQKRVENMNEMKIKRKEVPHFK
ncbi:Serine/threonine-protein phosphatase [Aphelenchoides besseyi]|nr:Serine/threonine-protein phosphatase [Aphelenchoides besseyi]